MDESYVQLDSLAQACCTAMQKDEVHIKDNGLSSTLCTMTSEPCFREQGQVLDESILLVVQTAPNGCSGSTYPGEIDADNVALQDVDAQ